jgi:hypothetical protein
VIAITKNYNGTPVAHTVLRELVAVLPAGDSLLRSVHIALGQTDISAWRPSI